MFVIVPALLACYHRARNRRPPPPASTSTHPETTDDIQLVGSSHPWPRPCRPQLGETDPKQEGTTMPSTTRPTDHARHDTDAHPSPAHHLVPRTGSLPRVRRVFRIVVAWMYNVTTQSVLLAATIHASFNTTSGSDFLEHLSPRARPTRSPPSYLGSVVAIACVVALYSRAPLPTSSARDGPAAHLVISKRWRWRPKRLVPRCGRTTAAARQGTAHPRMNGAPAHKMVSLTLSVVGRTPPVAREICRHRPLRCRQDTTSGVPVRRSSAHLRSDAQRS